MARSRRRTSRRRSGPKPDWVYRGPVITPVDDTETAIGTSESAGLASYTQNVISLASGAAQAQVLILYDSQNRLATLAGTEPFAGGQTFGALNRAARAAGKRPVMLATEGQMYIEPSTWAIGNVLAYGWRLGAWDQDPTTGLISLPAEYSMWQTVLGSNPMSSPDVWANSYNHVMEGRFWRGFNSNESNVMPFRMRWRGRRTLRPNECWGIYLEVPTTAVTMRRQPWFRTLVQDEG